MKNTTSPPKLPWFKRFFASSEVALSNVTEAEAFSFGGAGTISTLMTSDRDGVRSREHIYRKLQEMEGDSIVSTSLELLTIAALGGHETSGDLIFIEKNPQVKDKQTLKLIDEIEAELCPLFNSISFASAYKAITYGDSYARIYSDEKSGVKSLYVEELVHPVIVIPFERGGQTIGYGINTGARELEKLNISQMARLKMPRKMWKAQTGIMEKALRTSMLIDDPDLLPAIPASVGGSFLFSAEKPYDNFNMSLLGMVGQRWIDSIDEQILTVDVSFSTKEQQDLYMDKIKSMIRSSHDRAKQAVKTGKPVLEKIKHIIPVFDQQKGGLNIMAANGGQPGRSGTITIDDVMVHARMLSGSLGVDLAMVGFADQMSGGLGEGGFFRTSAKIAENARVIRTSLVDFFNHIIDIHTFKKYGFVYAPSERPWQINFAGSISALEAEKQKTRAEAMNSGAILVQVFQGLKDVGLKKDGMEEFMSKILSLDPDQARLFAKQLDAAVDNGLEEQQNENLDGFGQKPDSKNKQRKNTDQEVDDEPL